MACKSCGSSLLRQLRAPIRDAASVRYASSEASASASSSSSPGSIGAHPSGSSADPSKIAPDAASRGPVMDGRAASQAGNQRRGGRVKFPKPSIWLAGEGKRFKRPLDGRSNWLDRTPFPLNESFRPPVPVSDAQKSQIYNLFVEALKTTRPFKNKTASSSAPNDIPKSESYHLRQLSLKYNLSIDRIRAIVRLKAMESNLAAAGKELEYKFMRGMESALGVDRQNARPTPLLRSRGTQVEAEEAVKKNYATGFRANWVMLDEEASADSVSELVDEARAREARRRKLHEQSLNPQDLRLQALLRKDDKVRTRDARSANAKSARKGRRTLIEFVDVPGRKVSDYKKPAGTEEGERGSTEKAA